MFAHSYHFYIFKTLSIFDPCAAYNNRKAFSAPIGHIPPPDGPFRHLMIDHVDMLEQVQRQEINAGRD